MKRKVVGVLTVLLMVGVLTIWAGGVEAATHKRLGTPPQVGQGKGPRQDAPHHLHDAHSKYHNGNTCPNPQNCEFFKQNPNGEKGPNGKDAPTKPPKDGKSAPERPNIPPKNGQGRGARPEAPHHLQEEHAKYHGGKACPNPRTCDFFKKN